MTTESASHPVWLPDSVRAASDISFRHLSLTSPRTCVVAMTPLGYPASEDLIHPVTETKRKAESEVFVMDRFQS